MTMEDDSLNGSITVIDDKLPTPVKRKLSTDDKVHKILSDGNAYTLTGIFDADDTITSIGLLHGAIKKGKKEGWIEEDKCCECRQSTVFRLKKVIGKKRK